MALLSGKGKRRAIPLPILQPRPVLSVFGKGVKGAAALNFGLSGGKYCDRSCPHHPDSIAEDPTFACYAAKWERCVRRPELRQKLIRHEHADPADLCRQALAELQVRDAKGKRIPWFRFAVNGALPQPRQASADFRRELLRLLDWLKSRAVPVHFPVETETKRRFYQRLVGRRCVVRLSAASAQEFIVATVPVSAVSGSRTQSDPQRVKSAKHLAALRTHSSARKTIVCPAVAAKFLRTETRKAKCGNCVACAKADVDVVYPLHIRTS